MIAIALFIGLDQLWETSLLQGQQLLKSQTEKMARLLVQQTAYGAAPALQLENDEQLQWLAQALVLDPKVMSASIFSEDGVRLSFAQSVIDEELEADSAELAHILEQYPPYVEAVSQDGKNLGYVEVRLEPKYFFNEIKEAHQINMEQQQMMLLIAGLIGMLLSRALSFKRADFDRRKARVKLRQLLTKKNAKAAAKAAKQQAANELKEAKKTQEITPTSTDLETMAKSATNSGAQQPSMVEETTNEAQPKVAIEANKIIAGTHPVAIVDTKTATQKQSATESPLVKPRAKTTTTVKKPIEEKPVAKIVVKAPAKSKPKANVKTKAPVKPKEKPVTQTVLAQKAKPKARDKANDETKPVAQTKTKSKTKIASDEKPIVEIVVKAPTKTKTTVKPRTPAKTKAEAEVETVQPQKVPAGPKTGAKAIPKTASKTASNDDT
nr:AhpA/YtjB family protein [Shewanella marinintestina]